MKIHSIEEATIHFLNVYDVDIHGNEIIYEYIRFSENNWMMRFGESYEPIIHTEEKQLEDMFKESQNSKRN